MFAEQVAVSNLPATQAVSAVELPLPGGAATDALQLEMLSEVTHLLAAILDRLPRTDANHRAVVNTSDQGNVAVTIAAAQSLATVTTVTTVGTVSTLGAGTTAKPADGIPIHVSRMGSLHLLNQIIMS